MNPLRAFLGATLISATALTSFAQTTAFTYQGRLNDGASVASGSYDLRFALFDAPGGGFQQGNVLTNAATAISNGLFTVTLDFGDQFPGAGRWLEIGVRTNGIGAFATLSPRQQLTSTPYALRAANATTANSASSVAAANITGTIPLAKLPSTVVTNGASGVNITGTFSGNAGGLSNLNSANLTGPLSISLDPLNIGTSHTSGQAWGVAVSGNYAYVANGTGGLRVVDIGNPANPVNIGSTNNGGLAWGVAVSGNYAYLANDIDGLLVYDISNPANPMNIGRGFPNGGIAAANGVAVSGNYAYLADGGNGLRVFDISNPTFPNDIGGIYNGAVARGVAVSGNYVYLANDSDGLRVYNISNPAIPLNIGHTNNGGFAYGVAVSGNYAYLANYTDGLRVYDISNPANPVNIGHINNNSGQAYGVAVSGNYAYLANLNDGLRVYDISNPANPVNVGHIDNGGSAQGVAVSGNYAYLANANDGLRVYALSVVSAGSFRGDGSQLTGLNASQLSSGTIPLAQLPSTVVTNGPGGVNLSGTFSGNAGGLSNLNSANLTGPLSVSFGDPVNIGHDTRNNTASSFGVAVSGNYAYVADFGYGMLVYDISNPSNPIIRATTFGGLARGVAVSGDFAYLASSGFGLEVYYIGDPANPSFQTYTGGNAYGVAVSGNYAYLANSTDGLEVYDISSPFSPVNIGHTNNGGSARGVAVSGNYAYLANFDDGLRVYDIRNPANPVNIGHITNGGSAFGVAVSGNYAYLANANDGLRVYDISNPANPVNIGHINNGGQANGVTVSGNCAYLANYDDGLRVYDIRNPANPVNVGHIDNGGLAQGVTISGNYAYLANYFDGLRVYGALGVLSAVGFRGDGSALTNLNASQLTSGTLPWTALTGVDGSGLTDLNASQLAFGTVPWTALDGADGGGLINLNASQLTFGTVPWTALDGADGSGLTNLNASQLTFGKVPWTALAGVDGSGLTNLNASQLTFGTVPDAQLSTNVALRSGGNTFTGNQIITNGTLYNYAQAVVRPANPGWSAITEYDGTNNLTGFRAFVGADGIGLTGATNQMFVGTYSAHPLRFHTAAQARMTIDAGGNVGIGTTSPASKLDVNGDVRSAGTFIGNGSTLTSLNASSLGSGAVADARLSSNVALRSGGNTFGGDQTIAGGNLNFDNGQTIRAKNSSGTYENFLFPRWTDNVTYLNYGSNGFAIRNSSSVTTMFMQNDGTVSIAGSTSIGSGNQHLNLNIGYNNVTMTVRERPGDDSALSVEDSGGNKFMDLLSTGTKGLYLTGTPFDSVSIFWTTFSDERLKQDIQPYELGLKELLQLKTIRYRYKDDTKRGLSSAQPHSGVVAQEVQKVFPEAVLQDKDGYLSLQADSIFWASIHAVQELNHKVEERDAKIAELEKRLSQLEKMVQTPGGAK